MHRHGIRPGILSYTGVESCLESGVVSSLVFRLWFDSDFGWIAPKSGTVARIVALVLHSSPSLLVRTCYLPNDFVPNINKNDLSSCSRHWYKLVPLRPVKEILPIEDGEILVVQTLSEYHDGQIEIFTCPSG